MLKGATSPHRFPAWNDSLTNKLPSKSRKQRKRQASKKRRAMLRKVELD
jgi:hypothetical protein